MSKETSKRIAKIAAIGIRKPEVLTHSEIKSLSASVLAQKEKEMGKRAEEILREVGDKYVDGEGE